MEKYHKFVWPVTVLIACAILGAFYYASQANTQASLQKQQQADLQEKEAEQQAATDQTNLIAGEKAACVDAAQTQAVSEYQTTFCSNGNTSDDCTNDTYLVANYNSAYTTCLESKGLQ